MKVRAHNTAADAENKIHDDRVAAAYGYKGGLVPGVTVYGYMVPAVLEALGDAWFDRGGIQVRFIAPCYEGEMIETVCNDGIVHARREGTLLASGAVDIGSAEALAYPDHPLPEMDARPIAGVDAIKPGTALGTLTQHVNCDSAAAVPEQLLWLANQILVRNFRMSPWIHTGSDVRHHARVDPGAEVTVRGVIEQCFERKGRQFAVAGLSLSAGDQPVASVKHTFIFHLP